VNDPSPGSPAASPSRALLLLAAALFLLAAVIVAYSLGQRSALERGPAAPDGPDRTRVARAAPLFSLPSLRGPTRVGLADYRGQVVVLNFFASWDRGVAFVGIAIQDEAEAARGFLTRHGISYPAAIDMTGEVMQAYRVTAIPTTFFIAPDGRITASHAGIFVGDEGVARLQDRIARARGGAR
jgi:peroxiredoxin